MSLSPTDLFIGFLFRAWLLGGPGPFLATPLTIFLVLMLGTFPETRWLASVMGVSPRYRGPIPEEEMAGGTERRAVSSECTGRRYRKRARGQENVGTKEE